MNKRPGHHDSFKKATSTPSLGAILVVLFVCLGTGRMALSQVVPAAERNNSQVSVGGSVSGYQMQYGQLQLGGFTGFVDADPLAHLGIEAEGRWLLPRGINSEQATFCMAGPRLRLTHGKFEPYVKGLAGIGDFTLPDHYGSGSFLVVGGGAGLDYRLRHRIELRLVDFEYIEWPQFTFGAMSSVGVSTGIRIRVF
jgi:hypothetical protein